MSTLIPTSGVCLRYIAATEKCSQNTAGSEKTGRQRGKSNEQGQHYGAAVEGQKKCLYGDHVPHHGHHSEKSSHQGEGKGWSVPP